MHNWFDLAIIYHIYPLGFCGCETHAIHGDVQHRITKVKDWIPHLESLSMNAVYFGPLFASSSHGYDTCDYRLVDKRLGTNEDFKDVCDCLHQHQIRVILDGVFNHVGRDFWAFQDLREKQENSPYRDWFCNVRFHEQSPFQDPFMYEAWEGHYELVKLNLQNPEVLSYLFDSITMWIDEFDIDGLRLDAANCIDFSFFEKLRAHCKSKKPDFWLMGEIIHGDYTRWANPNMLDSVTNYECYKGLYSGHNTKNYFEIGHSFTRQFANQGIYQHLKLYNFVDNHDVNRLASTLQNQADLYNVYTLLYTMPGIPSVYYGSEWAIEGCKEHYNDQPLRPCLELHQPEYDLQLQQHIGKLGKIRLSLSALRDGYYEQVLLRNEQFVFKRTLKDNVVYVACNLSDQPYEASWTMQGNALMDELHDHAIYCVENNEAHVTIPAKQALILVSIERDQHKHDEIVEQCSVDPQMIYNHIPTPGRYRHFKGKEYEVIEVARHSETLEEYVVYRQLYGEGNLWIRPLSMFTGTVEINGKLEQRFAPIKYD